MHMPFQLRFCSSAAAPAATFLAVSRLIDSPYGVGLIVSGTASLGLFGSGGTCANAPVPVASARHRAPAITVKRRITSSLWILVRPALPPRARRHGWSNGNNLPDRSRAAYGEVCAPPRPATERLERDQRA